MYELSLTRYILGVERLLRDERRGNLRSWRASPRWGLTARAGYRTRTWLTVSGAQTEDPRAARICKAYTSPATEQYRIVVAASACPANRWTTGTGMPRSTGHVMQRCMNVGHKRRGDPLPPDRPSRCGPSRPHLPGLAREPPNTLDLNPVDLRMAEGIYKGGTPPETGAPVAPAGAHRSPGPSRTGR